MTARPARLSPDVRALAREAALAGRTVVIDPDGRVTISPAPPQPRDEFDTVDMRLK